MSEKSSRRGASDRTDERMDRFRVPGMDCPSCAKKVTASIESLEGVTEITATPTTGTVVVQYDPQRHTEQDVRERIIGAGYTDEADETTTELSVPGMDCPSCAQKIERALDGVDGMGDVETNPTTGRVVLTHDEGVGPDALVSKIADAGYQATPVAAGRNESTGRLWRSPRGLSTIVGAVLVTVGLVLHFGFPASDPPLFDLVGRTYTASSLFFILSAALAGAPILRNGYYSARNRSLDIDFLMSAGIIGSVATHHPFEGAMLAVLFSIAQLLERYSMDQARGSLRELMELSPTTATVLRDGKERTVPVGEIEVGETVVVRPGEKIPTDGVVTEGHSAVNQAPITGESVPVDRTVDEEVYAGTISESGYLEVQITNESTDSTISRIVRLVEDAQREKTDREQFVDRLAGVYTPLVVSLALGVALVPPLAFEGSWDTWFLRGLTLLVIACPCAFVISTPVSVVSGITSAARNGVLVKSGRDLEAVGETEVLAVDKTGTITTGHLSVTDVIPLDGTSESALLSRVATLEQRSEHPIAEAIVSHAEDAGVRDDSSEVDHFEILPGMGVTGTLDGVEHLVGKPRLFETRGFDLGHAHAMTDGGVTTKPQAGCDTGGCLDLLDDTVPRLERDGKTVVLVGAETSLLGVIAVADEPRAEAEWAVSKLTEQGVRVVMLTGDNEGTARAVADAVGIEEYHAELLPEEKLDRIRDLESEQDRIAMVGDGINDAPALANATVGIVMGAAGSDTALETADVALMGDDLSRVPYLYSLSRKSNSVIRQNIWSSLGMKAVLAVGAPFGIVTVIHAVVIGDMGMSLGVTGNAMRLSSVEPEEWTDGE